MKVAYFGPENWQLELIGALNYLGWKACINRIDGDADIVLNMSVSYMDQTMSAYKGTNRDKPLIVYNWDTYLWQFENARQGEYNWDKYALMLALAREIWCPSQCTVARQQEIYKQDGVVVKTFTPLHHLQDLTLSDKRFIFHAMRDYPLPELGWLEQACKELDIVLIRSNNSLPLSEYLSNLSACSLVVSHYSEASTGGLSAQEAAYLGKPVLLSDSFYNGGQEYLGDYATYFKAGDYNDFKKKLEKLWNKRKTQKPFQPITVTQMAREVDRRLRSILQPAGK